MKRLLPLFLLVALLIPSARAAAPAMAPVPAQAAVLMERSSGTVLFEQNPHEVLEPASVTKVMTMLLVMEALAEGRITLDEPVTVSAHAASMGGSQVFLEEGEQMTVHELLKAVAVASGNDAAVALGEHLAGSEDAFVDQMNQRAAQLGMKDTVFLNCTGLPAEGHVTSAYDIALMSRELLGHKEIRNYSTIWMDSLRNGSFTLANTNKLVRTYPGATGLKTGSTDSALYCLSASAEKDGMELIAVILKSPTSAERFDAAKNLLNYGFANYSLVTPTPEQALPPLDVILGERDHVQPVLRDGGPILVEKSMAGKLEQSLELAEQVEAPVQQGQQLGTLRISCEGQELAALPIVADQAVPKLTWGDMFWRLLQQVLPLS